MTFKEAKVYKDFMQLMACAVAYQGGVAVAITLAAIYAEQVMGFATPDQVQAFLAATPGFEQQLVNDGILLFKYWLTTDQKQQEKRLAERLADPLKRWKLSPVDLAAREKYDAYTQAREVMLKATHTAHCPWTLIDFNDQRRGRLTLIRDLLDRLPDTRIDPDPLELKPLENGPAVETFGILSPIAPYGRE